MARFCDGTAPCGPPEDPTLCTEIDKRTLRKFGDEKGIVPELKIPFWRAWNIAPHLSQQAAQYNLSSSGIAVFIMSLDIYDPEPHWAKDWSNAVGFAGAAIGMLLMGPAGDFFGRRYALLFTLSVCAGGVFIAGFAAGSLDVTYAVVMAGKFISGLGAGGLYPLGGCLAVEEARGTGARKVDTSAWVLANQIPVFFGGMILCFFCGFCAPTTGELTAQARGARNQEHLDTAFREELKDSKWWRALIGTAGTWFLFDVANYGIELATPDLVADVFGSSDNIPQKAGQSLAVLYCGIFGAAIAIIWIRARWSIKWLEIWGFLASMVICIIQALAYLFDWPAGVKFAMLCLLQVSLMVPNITTYVVPLLTYPTSIRCSYTGWSAFAGKVGAAVGAYVVPFVQRSSWGYEGVFWINAGVMLGGAIFCFLLLKDPPSWEEFLASTTGNSEASDTNLTLEEGLAGFPTFESVKSTIEQNPNPEVVHEKGVNYVQHQIVHKGEALTKTLTSGSFKYI